MLVYSVRVLFRHLPMHRMQTPFTIWPSSLFAQCFCFFSNSGKPGREICQWTRDWLGNAKRQSQCYPRTPRYSIVWLCEELVSSVQVRTISSSSCIECKHHSAHGHLHFSLDAFIRISSEPGLEICRWICDWLDNAKRQSVVRMYVLQRSFWRVGFATTISSP